MGAQIRAAYEGEMLTLREIAERTGIPYQTLYTRMNRHGITAAEAAEMGRSAVASFRYHGKVIEIERIAGKCGVTANALYKAAKEYGITLEQAADAYLAKVHDYENGKASICDIAKRNGLNAGGLLGAIRRHGKSAEQTAKIMVASREKKKHYGEKKASRTQRFKAELLRLSLPRERVARLLADEIYAELEDETMIRKPDGSFEFGSESYLFRVTFTGEGIAMLEGFCRSNGNRSMSRRYKYDPDGKKVKEIVRDSFVEDARLLQTLQKSRKITFAEVD